MLESTCLFIYVSVCVSNCIQNTGFYQSAGGGIKWQLYFFFLKEEMPVDVSFSKQQLDHNEVLFSWNLILSAYKWTN